jgi:hypothetical protein
VSLSTKRYDIDNSGKNDTPLLFLYLTDGKMRTGQKVYFLQIYRRFLHGRTMLKILYCIMYRNTHCCKKEAARYAAL